MFASVEHPQQRRLAELTADGTRRLTYWEVKRARRCAEFAARIPVMAAEVATEVKAEISAAVASEVNAAVAAALDAAFARQREAILDAVIAIDRARASSSTTPASSPSDLHAPAVALVASTPTSTSTAPASILTACAAREGDLNIPAHTTCSTQFPSRAVTLSVPALAPVATSASASITIGVVPEHCCLNLEPAAATSTPTSVLVISSARSTENSHKQDAVSTTGSATASVRASTYTHVPTVVLVDSTPASVPAATMDLHSETTSTCLTLGPSKNTNAEEPVDLSVNSWSAPLSLMTPSVWLIFCPCLETQVFMDKNGMCLTNLVLPEVSQVAPLEWFINHVTQNIMPPGQVQRPLPWPSFLDCHHVRDEVLPMPCSLFSCFPGGDCQKHWPPPQMIFLMGSCSELISVEEPSSCSQCLHMRLCRLPGREKLGSILLLFTEEAQVDGNSLRYFIHFSSGTMQWEIAWTLSELSSRCEPWTSWQLHFLVPASGIELGTQIFLGADNFWFQLSTEGYIEIRHGLLLHTWSLAVMIFSTAMFSYWFQNYLLQYGWELLQWLIAWSEIGNVYAVVMVSNLYSQVGVIFSPPYGTEQFEWQIAWLLNLRTMQLTSWSSCAMFEGIPQFAIAIIFPCLAEQFWTAGFGKRLAHGRAKISGRRNVNDQAYYPLESINNAYECSVDTYIHRRLFFKTTTLSLGDGDDTSHVHSREMIIVFHHAKLWDPGGVNSRAWISILGHQTILLSRRAPVNEEFNSGTSLDLVFYSGYPALTLVYTSSVRLVLAWILLQYGPVAGVTLLLISGHQVTILCVVQRYTSSSTFLAILNGRAKVQKHYTCMWAVIEYVQFLDKQCSSRYAIVWRNRAAWCHHKTTAAMVWSVQLLELFSIIDQGGNFNQTGLGAHCLDLASYFDKICANQVCYLDVVRDKVQLGHDHYLGILLELACIFCYLSFMNVCLDYNTHLDLVEVMNLQVPWDPGGLTRHRLEVKPEFKKGGMLATLLSADGPPLLGWAGLGCSDMRQGGRYIRAEHLRKEAAWNWTASASSRFCLPPSLYSSSFLCNRLNLRIHAL